MTDRSDFLTDGITHGLDHGITAVGYAIGLAIVLALFVGIPVLFWFAIQPWTERTAWRIEAWRRGRRVR